MPPPAASPSPAPSPDAAPPGHPAADLALSCRGLHGWLGEEPARNHVLRGVSLDLPPGQLCAIVGPSGCGKSSLLYLLGLLDRPDDGEIWLGGREYARATDEERTAARNRHIGFIFQFHFLIPEFTALENVTIPMQKAARLSPREMTEKARSLLAEMGLADKSARRANQLSGGEQQRVAVARALANDPSVILADEPTGNLDTHNSEAVFELLREVAHARRQAVLMVTHNLALAGRADRLHRMQDGVFLPA